MRIKKLLALALAGTMVFSMAACSGNKDGKSGSGSSEVTAKTVLEAFEEYQDGEKFCFSYDMIMDMKFSAAGMEFVSSSVQATKEGKGVKYIKETSKSNFMGELEESVSETYTITKEDGTVIEASKDVEDDEWDVTPILSTDEDDKNKYDIEEMEKTAKIENDGDMYYVTSTITAEQMGIAEDDMMAGLEDSEIEIVIAYDGKAGELKSIDINMDKKLIETVFSALLGEVEVTEFTMKIENIEKLDGEIEIPAEIELD